MLRPSLIGSSGSGCGILRSNLLVLVLAAATMVQRIEGFMLPLQSSFSPSSSSLSLASACAFASFRPSSVSIRRSFAFPSLAATGPQKTEQERTPQIKAAGGAGEFDGSIWHPEHPYRDAFVKTGLSVGSALLFGLGVWAWKGPDSGLEYYAGYLVEQSLSVDNLFVFVVLFEYFKVPTDYQGRVLSWGIFGAMAMRALMVLAGVEAIENFRVVLLAFAGILVFTSVKLLSEDDSEEGEEDLAENQIVKFARSLITTTDDYDGPNFFTEVEGRGRLATPLLLVLICVELSDVVFAVDSVPAVFGVTKDPFVVYTSNIFAILGLRSLYTVLANAMVDLPYLKPAVALILGLVGMKLGGEYFGFEVSNVVSLGVIASVLGSGVWASLYLKPKEEGQ